MDRIGSNNSNNQSYEPNTCEPLATPGESRAVASCPDGSVSYDNGVCADTGLKGPPTAAQRYINTLASNEGPQQSAPNPAAQQGTEAGPSARDTLQQLVEDVSTVAIDAVRTALDSGSMEAGKKREYAIELPNGCEAKFSVMGELETNGHGKPELVTKVSGSIEAAVGAVSAEVEFSYSRATSGQETLSFGACLFGGVDQAAAHLVELEAKAGLCTTMKDTKMEPPTVEIEAVAKAEASISFGGNWNWGHELEARTTLSKQTLPYDLLR